jgi:hypothetical protein
MQINEASVKTSNHTKKTGQNRKAKKVGKK